MAKFNLLPLNSDAEPLNTEDALKWLSSCLSDAVPLLNMILLTTSALKSNEQTHFIA